MNTAELLASTARSMPARVAWIWEGRERTYGESDARANAFARALTARGLAVGERVAVLLDNCPEVLETMFGCWKAGLVVVPLNARFTAAEIAYHVADAGARALVVGASQAGLLAPRDATVPGVEYIFQLGGALAPGHVDWEHELARHGGEPYECAPVTADDVAWIAYTSGTTGRAKGAMLTHGVLVFEVLGMLADFFPLTPDHVGMHAAPLTHGSGHVSLVLIAKGCRQVILAPSGFEVERFLDQVERHRVNALFLVPTIIKLIVDHPRVHDYDLSSLRWVFYGGSPMYVEDLVRARHCLGNIFIQGFGQTESPMTGTYLPAAEHELEGPHAGRLQSCGRARTGIQVRILDPDDRPVASGTVGEICIRGGSVMRGYWQRPAETAEVLRNGWLHTGDLGYMDADGYVYILDRSKDMVISGGLNIYPREIEELLLAHPAVAEACAFGIPDPKWGEALIAHVVPRPGHAVDAAALIAWIATRAAPYKKPKQIHLVAELAKTTYGKIDKKAIRAPYWAGRSRQVG